MEASGKYGESVLVCGYRAENSGYTGGAPWLYDNDNNKHVTKMNDDNTWYTSTQHTTPM